MAKANKRVVTRENGQTTTSWQVRYFDRNGKRRSKQFGRKRDAEAFAATIASEVQSGRHVHDRDTITVREAALRWLEACGRGRNGRDPCEPHTIRNYTGFVTHHIEPFLGSLKLNQLTPMRVKDFRDRDLLDSGRSRWMVKKCLGALSAICREAVADELLGVKPCNGIALITAGRHKETVTIPTKLQVQQLLQRARRWVDDPPRAMARRRGVLTPVQARLQPARALWWYTMLRFIVATGMRLSEIRGAARIDLDLPGGLYHVRQRADEKGRIGPLKSAAGYRDLELSDAMVTELAAWLKDAPESGLIFSNGVGEPESASNIYRRFWLPLLVECGAATQAPSAAGGIRHEVQFTVHDLRHFHASLMIDQGMQPRQLMEHMGHSSINVTMDVYGHLFKDEDARARRRSLVVDAEKILLPGPPPATDGSA